MDLKKMVQKIIKNGYDCVGVRSCADDEHYSVGDTPRESYDWDDECNQSLYDRDGENGKTVGGTCATRVITQGLFLDDDEDIKKLATNLKKAAEWNKKYYFGKQIVIAGHDETYEAPDEQEIRIIDAKVVAILD
ncbi:hypothetical protein OYT88_04505 [Sporolactobacillus sp. CQH2019]|uniref:hypothetical protein n=1 Tax=Sporolactobacillus sp. CQH2019 TaxID=3023512 RepID=UPI0023674AA4|nr:hypothetical protein [Sporolactobacillus sp. CQH2019]MDD9147810.1 hypothetical protein [Sporolactobacillus sp. CQH2019]